MTSACRHRCFDVVGGRRHGRATHCKVPVRSADTSKCRQTATSVLPQHDAHHTANSADRLLKSAFHDTDTDILARIVARMSARRSAFHGNNSRKSRVSDVYPREDVRVGVGVVVVEFQLNRTERRRLHADVAGCPSS